MPFVPPDITEAAITRACRALKLPDRAFSGEDGQDPRLPALKSLELRDVEACPGSGKTTLLVAKLAILAGLWNERRCGLCVLSHTNVARQEIERSLGDTAEGQSLLSYPHFIGTIHGFVNEFLAMPWLRSKGYPVEMIDDDVALSRRWRKLPVHVRAALQNKYLNLDLSQVQQRVLRIQGPAFRVGEIAWGNGGTLGENTPTYQALMSACRETAEEGYFCHDEMFVWAHDLIDKVPNVTKSLRARFPLLFIDEVQDNSELQSALLHRVFMAGENPVLRQRYGDANQAIYQSALHSEGAATDPFPIAAVRADIPNSFRFGQDIADLADPLALSPQGLQGRRQAGQDPESDTTGKHAIFLFDDQTVTLVLESYANYLIDLFSDDERRNGIFTALGAVHRPNGDDKVPRHIGHYWPEYDHAINRSDPQPRTFVQYVQAGHRLSAKSEESREIVEKIAEAVLRLVRIAAPDFILGTRKRKHRQVLDLLGEKAEAKATYLEMIRALGVERRPLDEHEWNNRWLPTLAQIVHDAAGAAIDGQDAQAFLTWAHPAGAAPDQAQAAKSDNMFRHMREDATVTIRVGSIHAAKGETHTATLVLDTFYRTHHLKALKAWLTGDRSGGGGTTAALQSRLKLHYVAMTRPARLLCLAMRADAFDNAEIAKLLDQGWRVAWIRAGGPEWAQAAEAAE